MRKVFVDFPINGPFALSSNDSRHILLVLRHVNGDRILVSDTTGKTYSCVITDTANHIATLDPVEIIEDIDVTADPVILAAGLLKGDKFDWVVQKATELGASMIVPVEMAHCVVKYQDKRALEKVVRWQRIALEAAKQCGRKDVPEIHAIVPLKKLPESFPDARFLVPYELEDAPLNLVCQDIKAGKLLICIGPEGGFDPDEIAFLRKNTNWMRTVSLGSNILRAETASLATLAIILYERGLK
jgi:16S rRNA (uracil1498-N3)-methyltransferase